MEKKHYPLIRTIYLYVFALLGLVLMVIGSVRFIDLGLKVLIFKNAENETRMINKEPVPLYSVKDIEFLKDRSDLSAAEKEAIQNWLKDYQNWKETSAKIDYLSSRREQNASISLAMIIIGLPLYAYHWTIIKKETKKRENGE